MLTTHNLDVEDNTTETLKSQREMGEISSDFPFCFCSIMTSLPPLSPTRVRK